MSSWLQLAGRTAIITGASSGIGKAVANELRQAGCRCILADIAVAPSASTTTLASSASSSRAKVNDDEDDDDRRDIVVSCNVTDRQDVQSLMHEAIVASTSTTHDTPHSGIPSILVNCAGITRDAYIGKLTDDDWDQVLDVNLKGTFYACQAFVEAHRQQHRLGLANHERRGGSSSEGKDESLLLASPGAAIVNVSSVVALQGNIGQTNYAASKGGVIGLTKALAKEVAPMNIRVNAVAPGFIQTPMTEAVPAHILQDVLQHKIPLQRMGRAQDVAHLVAFLVSDKSGYITGQIIECSGMIAL